LLLDSVRMSKPRVVRLRPLTPGQQARIAALKRVSQLLDSAFEVPGTGFRIGLDPIVGLVPGLGDLVSPMFAILVLWQSRDLGLPRIVQLRMLFNVAIDAIAGAVPVVGDAFDFAWKANDMNMALLERHAYEERSPAPGDWLFVLGIIALVLVIALLPFAVVIWLLAHWWR
jgi:hypothetical protein